MLDGLCAQKGVLSMNTHTNVHMWASARQFGLNGGVVVVAHH